MNPMAADSASPLSVLLQVLRDGLVDVPVRFGKLLARPVPTALSLDLRLRRMLHIISA